MNFPITFKVTPHKIYIIAIFIGIVSAVVCLGFEALYHAAKIAGAPLFTGLNEFTYFNFSIIKKNALPLFLLLLTGGMVSSFLIKKWSPESAGSGVDFYIRSFHFGDGTLSAKTTLVKFFATLLILSAGFPLGKEGPLLVIGAGIGAWLSGLLGFGSRARRTMYLAGAAGCLGAVFHAPLGGAITAIEILYREDFESDALVPAIISSVTAFAIFGSFMGFSSPFHFQTESFLKPAQLIACGFVGLLCSCLGQIFVWIFLRFEALFIKLGHSVVWQVTLAAIVVGILGLLVPMVLGDGLNMISVNKNILAQDRFTTSLAMIIGIIVLKMFLVGLTSTAGCSGGTLVPSFMIGGLSGTMGGLILRHFFPETFPNIEPFIAVGMVGYFSTVSRANLGALFMVSEFTQSYQILPNLMIACIVSLIFSKKAGLYKSQLDNKFLSPVHEWHMQKRREQVRTEGV